MTLTETITPAFPQTDLGYFQEIVRRQHALMLAKRLGRSVDVATIITLPQSFAGHRSAVLQRMESDEQFSGMAQSFDDFALQALKSSFASVDSLGAKRMEHDPTTMSKEVGAIYDYLTSTAEPITYEAVILGEEGTTALAGLRERFSAISTEQDGMIMGVASEYFAKKMLYALAEPPESCVLHP